MQITKTLYVANRAKWRAWLERNHEKQTEVWLVYYKKHTGRPSIPYDDAVEEALCFGWIDGIVKRMDEERYAQRFTPRRARSNWSEPNRKRVARLIGAGLMTPAGISKITFALGSRNEDLRPKATKRKTTLPRDLRQTLAANETAWNNFNNLAPSYQRHYVGWIMAAKKVETQSRRLREAIRLLEQNRKLGPK